MFLLGPATIHFAVAPEQLSMYPPYGLFVIFAGLLQVAIAAAVVLGPSPQILLGAAAFSFLVIAIWLVSGAAGLPISTTSASPEPVGLPDFLATLMEDCGHSPPDRRRPLRSAATSPPRPNTIGLTPVAAIRLVLTLAAVATAGFPASPPIQMSRRITGREANRLGPGVTTGLTLPASASGIASAFGAFKRTGFT